MSPSLRVDALPMGEFTFPAGEPYGGQTGVVVAYAVRYRGGVFLFDTGFAPPPDPELDGFYRRWRVQVRDLTYELAAVGIDRTEVTAVANCHLHVDHAGQNRLFPAIPIYVQAAEWAAAHGPDYTAQVVVDFPAAHYELINGDHEIGSGIRLFATPGHSPGHQSLVIDTPDGPLLLAGQAAYSRGEWLGLADAREGATSAPDGEAYRRSIARLRALKPKRVLFGHDRKGWPD